MKFRTAILGLLMAANLWPDTSADRLDSIDNPPRIIRSGAQVCNGCRYSPDGRLFAVGCNDGTLRLFSTQSWEPVKPLVPQGMYQIESIAFSLDGKSVACGFGYGRAIIVEVATAQSKELAETKNSAHTVRAISFDLDGKVLVSDGRGVRLCNPGTGESKSIDEAGTPVRCALSSDGNWLAAASADGKVKLLNSDGWKADRTLAGEPGPVSVAFSPDSTRLVAGFRDCTVAVWEVATGRRIAVLKGHTRWARAVACSPDGKYIASGGEDEVRVWDSRTFDPVAKFRHRAGEVRDLTFSPDSRSLAVSWYFGEITVYRHFFKPRPKGWLGAVFTEVDGFAAVERVLPSSPAGRAGLMPGDRVSHVEGCGVHSAAEALGEIESYLAGDRLVLIVHRGTRSLFIGARLAEPPRK